MSPSNNPFHNASYASGFYAVQPVSPPGSYSGASHGNNGALVVWNRDSLYGLYFNEQLHGPFATGRGVNPFTPGQYGHCPKTCKVPFAKRIRRHCG